MPGDLIDFVPFDLADVENLPALVKQIHKELADLRPGE